VAHAGLAGWHGALLKSPVAELYGMAP
jgi:hypothetical protein